MSHERIVILAIILASRIAAADDYVLSINEEQIARGPTNSVITDEFKAQYSAALSLAIVSNGIRCTIGQFDYEVENSTNMFHLPGTIINAYSNASHYLDQHPCEFLYTREGTLRFPALAREDFNSWEDALDALGTDDPRHEPRYSTSLVLMLFM